VTSRRGLVGASPFLRVSTELGVPYAFDGELRLTGLSLGCNHAAAKDDERNENFEHCDLDYRFSSDAGD
jgi:hypothetical protein